MHMLMSKAKALNSMLAWRARTGAELLHVGPGLSDD